VQDRVCLVLVDGLEQLARFCSGHGGQHHPSNPGLLPDLGHDRKLPARSCPHDQARRRPGNVLIGRQRRMPILASIRLRWSLLAAAYPARFQHDVVFEAVAIDHDDTKPWILNVHSPTIRPTRSGVDECRGHAIAFRAGSPPRRFPDSIWQGPFAISTSPLRHAPTWVIRLWGKYPNPPGDAR